MINLKDKICTLIKVRLFIKVLNNKNTPKTIMFDVPIHFDKIYQIKDNTILCQEHKIKQ